MISLASWWDSRIRPTLHDAHAASHDDFRAVHEKCGTRRAAQRGVELVAVQGGAVAAEIGCDGMPHVPLRMLDGVFQRRTVALAAVSPIALGDELRLGALWRRFRAALHSHGHFEFVAAASPAVAAVPGGPAFHTSPKRERGDLY